MPTYAPRSINRFQRLPLLFLTMWMGLFCGMGTASAQFHFKDYNDPHQKLISPDQILARSALLINARTGEVLFARNPDERLLPASTTKLMTALVVFEKIGLKGGVRIEESDRAEPSNIPVVPGETIAVDTLFHALLIESANDSARALGRYVAGSDARFIDMMNQRALALGCFNTHFNNPNGLPAPNGTHYTTCADLMKIFQAVIAHPELRQLCSTRECFITTASGTHRLRNHNRLLLSNFPGMGPAKTGWTEASKHTYAACVDRNGQELLLTILDSTDKWYDAQVLFNWGFAQLSAK